MEMGVISNVNVLSENRSVAFLAISGALARGALGGPHTPGQVGVLYPKHPVKIFSLFLITLVSSLMCHILYSTLLLPLTEYREESIESSCESDSSSSSACSTPDLRRGQPSRVSNDTITNDAIRGSTHR